MSIEKAFAAADPAIVPVEGPVGPTSAMPQRGAAEERRRTPEGGSRPSSARPVPPFEADAASHPYGLNNEQLPERLQEALRRLVFQYSYESESTRRHEIRRIKQAHQFWRGLQYLWWNERDQNWHLPFEQKLMDNTSLEDLPRYELVTNIYQAFGLSLISVLSQDVPRVRFFPTSAQAEEDVAAAKAATEVAALVERNNRVSNLIVDEAFNLWTDGKVGAYVRYVVDGQRFGFHPETEIAVKEIKVGNDVYVCPQCGAETQPNARPSASRSSDSNGPSQSASSSTPATQPTSGTEDSVDACSQCGALLTEENFVARRNRHRPFAANAPPRAKWPGSSHHCRRPRTQDSALGQRHA